MTLRAVSQPSLAVDYTLHRENDPFLNGQKPSYYPFKIPSHHQQLRHYISTVDANILYFISNNELHAVHLPTHQRERIASVPFVPTCLGAGYGWLCVGGYNKGQCAFIDLRDAPPFRHLTGNSAHPAEVDELLPLDLDPHSRLLTTQEQPQQEHRPARRRANVVTKEIGQQIVNAITVHRFEHKSKDVRDETVAVLSNNDKSVSLYSLNQDTILKTLPFPILMNHATISPDGQMLLAVGDEGRAFFRRRTLASQQKSSFRAYDWKELASVRLSGTVATDCCFSTAFSPSGHICAVASQFGIITLYNVSKIREDMEDDEAVIDILKGSRPCFAGSVSGLGAPRSMAFSPEPWDLLVWAEDHGRICVTDLRDGFRSRQTVHVNLDDEVVDRIELSDIDAPPSAEQLELERETLFVRRHQEALDAQDPLAAVQSAADYMESAAERRRRRMQLLNAGVSLNDEPTFSDAEREILETLRLHRLRENARESSSHDNSGRPFSINYSGHTAGSNSPSNLPISFGQYVSNRGNNRSSSSLFGYPRRRGSIVISNSNATNAASSSHPSSLTPGGPAPLSASPARLTPTSASESQQPSSARDTPPSPLAMPPSLNDPWQTISAAMASTSANQNSSSSSSRNLLPDISLANLAAERRQDDQLRLSSLYAHDVMRRVADGRRLGAVSSSAEGREASEELFRHRVRERERERESALRRERLRAMHAASNEAEAEAEALSRIERLQRLRSARFRQLRERAGLSGDSFRMSMGDEDFAFLQELSMLVDQGVTDRDPSSRMNGEVGIQGVGWTRDGRYLYVGTEEGILKYEVNIQDRMTFPGISLR